MTTITLLLGARGAAVGWTITALLTFLIGAPLLYFLALTFLVDDAAVERAVADQVQHNRLKDYAAAYACGNDIYAVLEKPLELAALGSVVPATEASAAARHQPSRRERKTARTGAHAPLASAT